MCHSSGLWPVLGGNFGAMGWLGVAVHLIGFALLAAPAIAGIRYFVKKIANG